MKKKLKKGDVYKFRWSAEERDKASKGWAGSLDHCFEGLLIVMDYPIWNKEEEKYNKELRLVDTFWGINRTENNKSFTLKDAEKRGILEFYCNLNDIVGVKEYELDEYDDGDLFRLHTQHSCTEHWFRKKKSKKSASKKISVLQSKIKEEKHSIEWSVRKIEQMSAEIKDLEINGLK